MTVKKILPRCVSVTRNGSTCGRRVSDGSNPPICHIHKLQAQGSATSPLIPSPDEIDEVAILRKLARDSNPQVRLRAVDLLLSLKDNKQPCAKCAQVKNELDVKMMTPDERAVLAHLVTQLKELKARVNARLFPQEPEDDIEEPRTEREHHQPTRASAAAPKPADKREHTAADAQPTVEEVAPYQLPRDLWESVGLFEQNDVVTHAYGDEHAAKILSGAIPMEQAQAEQAEATAHMNRMGGSTANITKLTW